ncbi:unnamed protein product [Vicia faba]|uniref:Secreted protein n=1 Tax=Vicia faba TaxID=3906 RepID=A0AAV0Z5K3_VICFA|nr:unnamed protein product [Vicia faba]
MQVGLNAWFCLCFGTRLFIMQQVWALMCKAVSVQAGINIFRFMNCIAELENFLDTVADSWRKPVNGRPMVGVWKKLLGLQQILRKHWARGRLASYRLEVCLKLFGILFEVYAGLSFEHRLFVVFLGSKLGTSFNVLAGCKV